MTLANAVFLIGNPSEESCLRCFIRTVKSSEDVPVVLLTMIWFNERPMKSNEAAAGVVTNAGSNSFLISYSCCSLASYLYIHGHVQNSRLLQPHAQRNLPSQNLVTSHTESMTRPASTMLSQQLSPSSRPPLRYRCIPSSWHRIIYQ